MFYFIFIANVIEIIINNEPRYITIIIIIAIAKYFLLQSIIMMMQCYDIVKQLMNNSCNCLPIMII